MIDFCTNPSPTSTSPDGNTWTIPPGLPTSSAHHWTYPFWPYSMGLQVRFLQGEHKHGTFHHQSHNGDLSESWIEQHYKTHYKKPFSSQKYLHSLCVNWLSGWDIIHPFFHANFLSFVGPYLPLIRRTRRKEANKNSNRGGKKFTMPYFTFVIKDFTQATTD